MTKKGFLRCFFTFCQETGEIYNSEQIRLGIRGSALRPKVNTQLSVLGDLTPLTTG